VIKTVHLSARKVPAGGYCCQVLIKFQFCRQSFEKSSNSEFHENQVSGKPSAIRTDGRTDRQTIGRTHTGSRTDGQTDRLSDGWTDRQSDGQTIGRTDGRTDSRTDTHRQSDVHTQAVGRTERQTDCQTDGQTDRPMMKLRVTFHSFTKRAKILYVHLKLYL
jgi:hypothetical protein